MICIRLVVLRCVLTLCILKLSNCRQFIPDTKCATLYSGEDRKGDQFILENFDQSVSTTRDYRNSLTGWSKTESIKVEDNCTLVVCDNTYLTGNCTQINSGVDTSINKTSSIRSARCNCQTDCTCSNFFFPIPELGRRYHDGCTSCQTEYYPMVTRLLAHSNFSPGQSYHVRIGCNLTVYSDSFFRGRQIVLAAGSHVTGMRVGSYKFDCGEYTPAESLASKSGMAPPPLRLPGTSDELAQLIVASSPHPGIDAALASMERRRSWRNAYFLLIGSEEVDVTGVFGCKNDIPANKIGECRLPVKLDHLGISDAEIKLIYVNVYSGGITYPSSSDNIGDSRVSASIDAYLESHDELKHTIPNAVIVINYVGYGDINDHISLFQRKFAVLNALRNRVVDERYSNVIFVIDNSYERNPETQVEQFRTMLSDTWDFPAPINILCRESGISDFGKSLKGSGKMRNREYWPRNMQQIMLHMTHNAGDELGFAIFKAAFTGNVGYSKVTYQSGDLINWNNSKALQYFEYLKSPYSVPRRVSCVKMENDLETTIRRYRFKMIAHNELEMLKAEIHILKLRLNTLENSCSGALNRTKAEIIEMVRL